MRSTLLALKGLGTALVLFGLCTGAWAAEDWPQKSHDGLVLEKKSRSGAIYKLPGADLGEYDKVSLVDAYVAFRKNYKRDHNRQAMTLEDRLSDKDLDKMRTWMAQEFKKMFEKVLVEEGGHQLAEQGTPGTLIIRPAIVNLDVTAPDKMTSAEEESFTASAGSMTLYMELYDGGTGQILYRIVDAEAGLDRGYMRWTNSVTNKAEADRILRKWATALDKHLKAVKSQDS